jgi:hypothetical protein
MKFITGATYTNNGRECVLVCKEKDENNQLVVGVRFVGTSKEIRVVSYVFNRQFRLVKAPRNQI